MYITSDLIVCVNDVLISDLNPIKFYLFNNKMRTIYWLTICLAVAALVPLAVNTFWPVMLPEVVSPGLCLLQHTYR